MRQLISKTVRDYGLFNCVVGLSALAFVSSVHILGNIKDEKRAQIGDKNIAPLRETASLNKDSVSSAQIYLNKTFYRAAKAQSQLDCLESSYSLSQRTNPLLVSTVDVFCSHDSAAQSFTLYSCYNNHSDPISCSTHKHSSIPDNYITQADNNDDDITIVPFGGNQFLGIF